MVGIREAQDLHLLDIGCGNGNLAHWLADQGFTGTYTGVEQSSGLISTLTDLPGNFKFHLADLAQPDWLAELPTHPFDLITCFAVLHHLPGEGLRVRLLRELKRLLAPEGTFLLSVWQFMNSPRLVGRIQSWEAAGMADGDVDEVMCCLTGVPKVNPPVPPCAMCMPSTEDELQRLAGKSSFQIQESWSSDGKEGCLGLYQVWSRA